MCHMPPKGASVKRVAAFWDAHAGKFIVLAIVGGWSLFFAWLYLRGYLRPS
jgi:hypothetical protein